MSFVDRSLAKLAAEIEKEALAKRRASPIRGTAVPALPPSWEYRVVELAAGGAGSGRSLEERLNELGLDGWELVSHGGAEGLVLKRPRVPPVEQTP